MAKCKGRSGRIQEEREMLTAMDVAEELISNRRYLISKGNGEVDLITENAILGEMWANWVRELYRVVSEFPGEKSKEELRK